MNRAHELRSPKTPARGVDQVLGSVNYTLTANSTTATAALTLLDADQGIEQVLIGTGVASALDIRGKGALNVNAGAGLTTGTLSFDADGNGKTGAVAFAQLPTSLASLVTSGDFLIIA